MLTKEECELALKEILSLASPCSLEVYDHRSSYLKERYELLEQLIKEHFDSKWIPVEERLPEVHWFYTVCFDDGFITTVEFDGDWILWADATEVVAWMPLPKPYRKEDEE